MANTDELSSPSPKSKGKEGSSNSALLGLGHRDINIPEASKSPVSRVVSSLCDARDDTRIEPDLRAAKPDPNLNTYLPKSVDPLAEFDEYGTELRKDARVWKVYVEEADKYDKELVTGWKDSIDMILIFAALFSAISTAFLIESSKKLEEDPAEVAARTLLVISQTLMALTNSTQPLETTTTPEDNIVGFKPTNKAIWINTLWYLSLSLSLATAFIGILAKEWCHSFLTGRTGHPYEQSERRQHKWDMIEHWKMPEVLTMLPSLIHAALLLFAIGMCIYLWEMHMVVSIPVICVSGIACGFYMWSSLSACMLEHFPYPTIVSRIYRTQWIQPTTMRRVKAAARQLFSLFTLLALELSVLVLRILHILLAILFVPANSLGLLIFLLDLIPSCIVGFEPPALDFMRSLREASSIEELVRVMLHGTYMYLVWKPASLAHVLLHWTLSGLGMVLSFVYESDLRRVRGTVWSSMRSDVQNWVRRRKQGLIWKWLRRLATVLADRFLWGTLRDLAIFLASPRRGIDPSERADVTSRALGWLIQNCETPQSVDIALQSIAGANERISREPLLECQATLQILRRLASSNLYRDLGAKTDAVVALYSRALLFLSDPSDSRWNGQTSTRSELEVLIWDLQLETEKKVANLITNGNFEPTQNNLDALRIGNTAASNSLKILKSTHNLGANINEVEVLDTVIRLLGSSNSLHQAALLSLVHAAVLISLFSPTHAIGSALPLLCVRLARHRFVYHRPTHAPGEPDQLLITNLAVACALLCDEHADRDRLSRLQGLSWSEGVIRNLLQRHSEDTRVLDLVSTFGQRELESRWEPYAPTNDSNSESGFRFSEPAFYHFGQTPSTSGEASEEASEGTSEDDTLDCIQALSSICDLSPIGSANPENYYFLLGVMLNLYYHENRMHYRCRDLISRCRFPTRSNGHLSVLRNYSVIDLLQKNRVVTNPTKNFLATGHLWLIFTLYLGSPYTLTDNASEVAPELSCSTSRQLRHGHYSTPWDQTESPTGPLPFTEMFGGDYPGPHRWESSSPDNSSVGSRSPNQSQIQIQTRGRSPIRVRTRTISRSHSPVRIRTHSRDRNHDRTPIRTRDRPSTCIRIRGSGRNHSNNPIPIRIHTRSRGRSCSPIIVCNGSRDRGRSPARIRIHKRSSSHSPIRVRVRNRGDYRNGDNLPAHIVRAGAQDTKDKSLDAISSRIQLDPAVVRCEKLLTQIERLWERERPIIVESLGIWAYRLMECVSRARNTPLSKELYEALQEIPLELRDFIPPTSWWPQENNERTTNADSMGLWETSGGTRKVVYDEDTTGKNKYSWGPGAAINEGRLQGEEGGECTEMYGDHETTDEHNGATERAFIAAGCEGEATREEGVTSYEAWQVGSDRYEMRARGEAGGVTEGQRSGEGWNEEETEIMDHDPAHNDHIAIDISQGELN